MTYYFSVIFQVRSNSNGIRWPSANPSDSNWSDSKYDQKIIFHSIKWCLKCARHVEDNEWGQSHLQRVMMQIFMVTIFPQEIVEFYIFFSENCFFFRFAIYTIPTRWLMVDLLASYIEKKKWCMTEPSYQNSWQQSCTWLNRPLLLERLPNICLVVVRVYY